MTSLSILIVSYETRDLTLRCLEHFLGLVDAAPAEIWRIEKAFTDGTADAVASAFPGVHALGSKRNLGFGGGHNLALEKASGECVPRSLDAASAPLLHRNSKTSRRRCRTARMPVARSLLRRPGPRASGPRGL